VHAIEETWLFQELLWLARSEPAFLSEHKQPLVFGYQVFGVVPLGARKDEHVKLPIVIELPIGVQLGFDLKGAKREGRSAATGCHHVVADPSKPFHGRRKGLVLSDNYIAPSTTITLPHF
jgi:hypothetical protein